MINLCLEAGGPVTQSNNELAKLENTSFVTVSKNIGALEDAGFIRTSIDKDAGNKRSIWLTEALVNAIKTEKFPAAGLLNNALIATLPIKENINTLLKKVLIADAPIKDSFNSLLKDYLIGQGCQFAENQTVILPTKESFNSPTEISGRTPIEIYKKENRDSININSKNLNVSINNNLGVQLENESDSKPEPASPPDPMRPGSHAVIPYITVGQQRITPDEIGLLLKIRGVPHERTAPYVEENRGKNYNDMDELRNLVRTWLRAQKPEKSKPKLTIEEQVKNLRIEISKYRREHPNLYPDGFYKDFLDYWSTPNKAGTLILRETKTFFNIGQTMAYSYKNIYIPNLERSEKRNNKSGGSSKGGGGDKTSGHVDFSQFITGRTEEGGEPEGGIVDGDAEFVE
ncbi:hypothetical protein GCM10027347_44480 [Larkinella harenae]